MPNRTSIPEYLKLQAILDHAVDAIITIDEKGRIESANSATITLFQFPIEELLGNNVSMLMPSPYHEEHDQYVQNYLRTGVKRIIGSGREVVGRRKDGSQFPMHLAVSEIAFDSRRFFTGVVRDITDLQEARNKLELLNRELEDRVEQKTQELRSAQEQLVAKEKLATLGEVAGGIAHEIRNPLNALRTSAYFLLNAKLPAAEKQRQHFERIDRQVSKINNVVTALSDIARLPEPSVSHFSPEESLRQAVDEVSLPTNISVVWDFENGLKNIQADYNQLPIVFRNLLRNARDAMPDGGVITIRGRTIHNQPSESDETDPSAAVHQWVSIAISDTGIGIEPDKITKVTEPLYSTKARGMGLGLAICKSIMDKNRGLMSISSELGIGSRFTILLPATRENEAG